MCCCVKTPERGRAPFRVTFADTNQSPRRFERLPFPRTSERTHDPKRPWAHRRNRPQGRRDCPPDPLKGALSPQGSRQGVEQPKIAGATIASDSPPFAGGSSATSAAASAVVVRLSSFTGQRPPPMAVTTRSAALRFCRISSRAIDGAGSHKVKLVPCPPISNDRPHRDRPTASPTMRKRPPATT